MALTQQQRHQQAWHTLQAARPALSNGGEAWLFHGAHKTCVEAIAAKGFDIRVSNRGVLGQGTYFASSTTYSDK